MDVEIRAISAEALFLIGQVDRSEVVTAKYVARRTEDGMGLRLVKVVVDPVDRVPHWNENGVRVRATDWARKVEAGGAAVGAFIGEAFVGFAVIGPVGADDTAELAALFVHAGYRGKGVGKKLMLAAEEAARAKGVRALWIASNATESAVEFYLRHGCQLLKVCENSQVPHEVGDPMFVRVLG